MSKGTKGVKGSEQEIVIVQAGFVFAGVPHKEGDLLVLEQAVNVRVWGTTAGLGQLAITGRSSDTVLDPYGIVKIPKAAILARIPCQVDLT